MKITWHIPLLILISFTKAIAQEDDENELSIRQKSFAFVAPMCEAVSKEKDPTKWIGLQQNALGNMTNDSWTLYRSTVMQLRKKFADSTTSALELMLEQQIIAWTYESCKRDSSISFEDFERKISLTSISAEERVKLAKEHQVSSYETFVLLLSFGYVDSLNALFDSSQTFERSRVSLDTLGRLLQEQFFKMDVLPKAESHSGSLNLYRFDLMYEGEAVYELWIGFDANDIYSAVKTATIRRVGKPVDPDFFKSPDYILKLRYRMINNTPKDDRFETEDIGGSTDTSQKTQEQKTGTEAPKTDTVPAPDGQAKPEGEIPKNQ